MSNVRRSIAPLLIASLVAAGACSVDRARDDSDLVGLDSPDALAQLKAGTDAQDLWDQISSTDSSVVVGLTVPGKAVGVARGVSLLTNAQRQAAEATLIGRPDVTLRDRHEIQPAVLLKVSEEKGIAALLNSPFVEYVEANIDLDAAPMSGCSGFPGSFWGGSVEYYEGDILPWNLAAMQVPDAWDRSSGQGVRIGLVDTGIDPAQDEIFSNFSSGQSTGRIVQYDATSSASPPFAPWGDDCGHGTHLAGVIAAPKNSGHVLGVAWSADLVSVRHHDDVWNIGSSWATGMAIDEAAGTYSSDIIEMAFKSGSHDFVRNVIEFWYDAGRLFVGAAGTFPCSAPKWVVFPASLPEVMSVSAAEPNGSLKCSSPQGAEVSAYADQPTTGNLTVGDATLAESGESSNASAVIAGIAALVWAEYPAWTRDQVRNRVAWATLDAPTSTVHIVNAFGAVGGLFGASVSGPSVVEVPEGQVTYVQYSASPWKAGGGSLSYQWNQAGGSSQTATYPFESNPDPYTIPIGVTVTDLGDGTQVYEEKMVEIRRPEGCGGQRC